MEFQEIQHCGRANRDLVLGLDMVCGLNLSLVTFRLIMQSMHFNRKLSTLASAILLPDCLLQWPSFLMQFSALLCSVADNVAYSMECSSCSCRSCLLQIWPLFWENEEHRNYFLLFSFLKFLNSLCEIKKLNNFLQNALIFF